MLHGQVLAKAVSSGVMTDLLLSRYSQNASIFSKRVSSFQSMHPTILIQVNLSQLGALRKSMGKGIELGKLGLHLCMSFTS
jgi:hypothetical protein